MDIFSIFTQLFNFGSCGTGACAQQAASAPALTGIAALLCKLFGIGC